MTEEAYDDILYDHRILRWSARIAGTVEAAVIFKMAFTEFWEEIANHSPSPLVTMIGGQYFLAITLAIAFTGLIIAYWQEGVGGAISLTSFIVLFIGWGEFHVVFLLFMFIAAAPGILYFWYGLSVYLAVWRAKFN